MSEGTLASGHAVVVDALLERLRLLQAGDASAARVVILRGASGAGKTRIIRELYARLRRENGDKYWPKLPGTGAGSDTGGEDAAQLAQFATRQVVKPPVGQAFTWPVDTAPSFGWWAFDCNQMKRSQFQDVIGAIMPQLDAHLLPLIASWRLASNLLGNSEASGKTLLLQISRAAASSRANRRLHELLGQNQLLDANPAIASLTRWGWLPAQSWLAQPHRKVLPYRQLGTPVPHRENQAAEGRNLAEVFQTTAHPHLPAVVVIENIHLMGQEMAKLAASLSKKTPTVPILVVGTTNHPGNAQAAFTTWLEKAEENDEAEIWDVPQIGADELVKLIQTAAPGTDYDLAKQVAKAMPDPLWLTAWLNTTTAKQTLAKAGSAQVPTVQAADFPKNLEETLEERWQELPPKVRTVLTVAVAANPLADPLAQFPLDLIAKITNRVFLLAEADARQAGTFASESTGWCRETQAVQSFTDERLVSLLKQKVLAGLSEQRQQQIRQVMAQAAGDWLATRGAETQFPLSRSALVYAHWYLASSPETDASASKIVSLMLTAQYHYRCGDYQAALSAIERAKNCGDNTAETEPTSWARLTILQAECLAKVNRFDEAISEVRSLLQIQNRLFGAGHPNCLDTLQKLATLLYRVGQCSEATNEFEAVLGIQMRFLGEHHPATLTTIVNIVHSMRNSDRELEALTVGEHVLDTYRHLCGEDHPETFEMRGIMAYYLWQSGLAGVALVQLTNLLRDQRQTLGDSHADVHRTKEILLDCLRQSDNGSQKQDSSSQTWPSKFPLANSAEPQGMAQEVDLIITAVCEQTSSQSAPDTLKVTPLEGTGRSYRSLKAQKDLAFWLKEQGLFAQAILEFEDLLYQQMWLNGREHWSVLKTRRYLAETQVEAQQFAEAISELESVVLASQQVLGEEHQLTLLAQQSLARSLGKAGRIPESIEAYLDLLAVDTRVLGPKHFRVTRTRFALADLCAQVGELGEAVSYLELNKPEVELTSEGSQALFLAHGEALFPRQVKRVKYAIQELSEYVARIVEILGENHEYTLASRAELAYLLGKGQWWEEAENEFSKILEPVRDTHGEDHFLTLRTRCNLAVCRVNLGKKDQGITELIEVLPILRQMLGEEHPATGVVARNLTMLMLEV